MGVRVLLGAPISPLPLKDPEALARFEREARAIAALSHPNIRGIFDLVRQADVVFAVMELLEGEPRRARLLEGPLPQNAAADRELAVTFLLTGHGPLGKATGGGRVHETPELVEVTAKGAPASRWQQRMQAELTDVF